MNKPMQQLFVVVAVIALVSSLAGQSSPALAPTAADLRPESRTTVGPAMEDEGVVQLSPFEVTTDRDIGNRAATSTSGSRMNEEIKNIPASISVMTSEFLADTRYGSPRTFALTNRFNF